MGMTLVPSQVRLLTGDPFWRPVALKRSIPFTYLIEIHPQRDLPRGLKAKLKEELTCKRKKSEIVLKLCS